jgi:hypothetical protein
VSSALGGGGATAHEFADLPPRQLKVVARAALAGKLTEELYDEPYG